MNKNKLHILFISSWYPSRVFPTNGDFVQRHAETMSIDHEITVIHVVTDATITKKVEIVDKKVNNVRTIIAYVPSKNSIYKLYSFYKAYASIIKKIGVFDLVHLNISYPKGLVALYLKKIKKKPYIITEHWTGYQNPLNKSIGFFRKLITKSIVKNASFVCPVSKNLASEMQQFGLKGTYKIVPNVVNTAIFTPKDKAPKTFTIVSISNLFDEQKNITGLLNVVKKLSKIRTDFIFKIVGNSDPSEIKKHIEKLKIAKENIQFIGTKTQNQIAEILQNSSVYASFSNYETFGLVMAESLATGTPVISTDTGILTEINASEYSTIIPIKDEEKLLQTLLKYMDENSEYNAIKMHTFIDERYSKSIICKKFTEIYYESINHKRTFNMCGITEIINKKKE